MMRYVIDSPRPIPWPSRRRVKNGSKMCSSVSGSMPQPLSATVRTARSVAGVQFDADRAAVVEAVQRVGQQVQHDLLDFLRIHVGRDRLARGEADVLSLIFSRCARAFRSRRGPTRPVRCFPACPGPMREKSSSFSVIPLQRNASV